MPTATPVPTKTTPPRPLPTSEPTSTPTPIPTPTASPTPTGPSQDQISAARALGVQDGAEPGSHEALERAPKEARAEGLRDGRSRGFESCERDEINRSRDVGFRDGYAQGQTDGSNAGVLKGREDGQARGQYDGNQDGFKRADAESARVSSGPGRQQGIEEANASDASSRGNTDGSSRGDREAQAAAQAREYPRGHQDYNNERQNEPVRVEDSFNQKAPVSKPLNLTSSLGSFLQDSQVIKSMASRLGISTQDERRGGGGKPGNGGDKPGDRDQRPGDQPSNAKPDHRYSNPLRTFPSPQEQEAYREGYTQGYDKSFATAYNKIYNKDYREHFQRAERDGCEDARRRDYRDFYHRAYVEGRDKGYSDTYQVAYNSTFRATYNDVFRIFSEESYSINYPILYKQHFEEFRSAAYREQYEGLYDSAFSASRDQTYNKLYPGYAQAAYKKGRADEEADFVQRPVRLLDVVPTETIENGLFEPGEALRIRLSMRNFADATLAGKDIKMVLQALDAGSAVLSTATETLTQNIRAKSVTTVSEALDFRMNENAVNQAKQFRVTLYYQGRNVGEQVFTLTTKFITTLQIVGSPQLREGLESSLAVKVRNQSNKPTEPSLKVVLTSDPAILQVTKGSADIGVLNPGEERIVEFSVIARAHGASIRVPYVLQSLLGSGRRIGLTDGEKSVPLVNDYRISVSGNTRALRANGVTRMQYTITNISSRLLLKGLQLKARILGNDAQNFVIIGPNPQYLTPLIKGQSLSFDVPILVKAANSGGSLELEVQEDGRTVVISQTDF
ncbi:MAG: hypothetical protein A2Z97_10505 [Bdellovibrionales bacterium GWB1_52_6]|nr:MAG: hypothetical protein A2Z97_10505 [Bdellovibrionales bacterium GWB1_52_6]